MPLSNKVLRGRRQTLEVHRSNEILHLPLPFVFWSIEPRKSVVVVLWHWQIIWYVISAGIWGTPLGLSISLIVVVGSYAPLVGHTLDRSWSNLERILPGSKPKNLTVFKTAPKEVREKVMAFHTIRDLEIAFRKVRAAKHVVILGGGPLGTELAWHLGRMSECSNFLRLHLLLHVHIPRESIECRNHEGLVAWKIAN